MSHFSSHFRKDLLNYWKCFKIPITKEMRIELKYMKELSQQARLLAENKIKSLDESVDVFNGNCYWCVSTSNEIYLLKKECSGEKNIEIVSKIEGTTLNTTQYNENTMFIITANSVYKYDYTKSKELQLLYECKLRKYTKEVYKTVSF